MTRGATRSYEERRTRESCLRWAHAFGAGLVGASIYVALGHEWIMAAVGVVAGLGPIRAGALAVLLAALLARCAGRKRWLAFFGMRRPGSVPPPWFGGVFGAWLVVTVWWFTDTKPGPAALGLTVEDACIVWLGLTCVLMAMLLVALGWVLSNRPPQAKEVKEAKDDERAESTGAAASEAPSPEAETKWLQNDEPINEPRMDRFGHFQVAVRIVRRLERTWKKTEQCPTIAIVGPLGSGKTSIVNLIRHELHHRPITGPSIRPVQVSVWHYESAAAVISSILEALLDELGSVVNVATLRGVPDQYAQAIEKVGGVWGALPTMLGRKRDPTQILDSYNRLALAAGIRVVVFVEDLERFAYPDPTHPVSSRADERLAPIRALLHTLDRLTEVSVVVMSTSLSRGFDLEKLARFIEHPPRLRVGDVKAELRRHRSGWLRRFEELIDPAHYRTGLSSDLEPYWENDPDPWFTAVAEMISTPRTFKQVLRACDATWEQLAGEIDPDHLLLASVLHVVEPAALTFIDDRFRELRKPHDESSEDFSGARPTMEQELASALATTSARVPADRVKQIASVLDFLFPVWRGQEESALVAPQGFAICESVDYWERYRTVPELAKHERDQEVLRAIARWRSRSSDELVKMVRDPHQSEKVVAFRHSLHAKDLIRLLQAVGDGLASARPNEWRQTEFGTPMGLLRLRQLFMRSRESPLEPKEFAPELKAVLVKFVRKCTRTNLAFVSEVCRLFAMSESPRAPVLSGDAIEEIKCTQRQALADIPDCETLVRSLRGASPFVLHQASWGLDRLQEASPGLPDGLPFDGWAKFAGLILQAEPAIVIPQIVPFLVTGRTMHAPHRFAPDRANQLFGISKLTALFAKNAIDAPSLDEDIRSHYGVVVDGLREAETR
ncbi:MAG: P-loop NTPase fold protein [Nannocystaceae bacterium]